MIDIYTNLKQMKLPGMAKEYQRQCQIENIENLSFNERLELVIEAEKDNRNSNKIKALLRGAKFSEPTADIANIKYFPGRVIDRSAITELATNNYITRHSNVIIVGACGTGKSYIANALGVHACLHKVDTRYVRLPELLDEYKIAANISIAEARKVIKKYLPYFSSSAKIDEEVLVNVSITLDEYYSLQSKIENFKNINSTFNSYLENGKYDKSSNENIIKFRDYLNEHGIVATIRRELGSDIDAACGQLRRNNFEEQKEEKNNE